jgi:hypothetical protein
MSAIAGARSSDRSPFWLLVATILGGILLGQGNATSDKLEPGAKPPETSKAAAAQSDQASESRADGEKRVYAPYYAFLGVPATLAGENQTIDVGRQPPTGLIDAKIGRLEFLIVTVADPVDTHLSYRFDLQIETLHRVCAAGGYVIDRFYLPWDKENDQESGAEKHDGGRHRDKPGLLLYRKQSSPEPPSDKTDLLAVYLVGETPTSGIQFGAFHVAVGQIAGFLRERPGRSSARHEDEVMISGPTFSGAADSLARAIRDARDNHPDVGFRVITGEATSVNDARFLELAGAAPDSGPNAGRVHLYATVASNAELTHALIEYAEGGNRASKPIRIAWLTESGTGFGASAVNGIRAAAHFRDRRSSSDAEIVNFQFPVNIARVRAAYQEERRKLQAAQPALGPDRYRVPIPLNDDGPVRDLPPMQTPNLTAPSAELVIGQILATIRNEGFEYVGISASDIRDPVFLTELIKEQVPDAQILLVTTDLLHLHSEYRATMHGALVASPYSLCPEDQDWCFPFEGRQGKVVLANQNLYGLYNSVVFLRGLQQGDYEFAARGSDALADGSQDDESEADGAQADDGSTADNAHVDDGRRANSNSWLVVQRGWSQLGAKPLAYGMPLAGVDRLNAAFGPPIWISMIGTTGVWPLRCAPAKKVENDTFPSLIRVKVDWRHWIEPSDDKPLRAPKFDPRIAVSSEFLMGFWAFLALVYVGGALGLGSSKWAGPFTFKEPGEGRFEQYLCPRRVFRMMITLALLVVMALDAALAAIPVWFREYALDGASLGMPAILSVVGGLAVAGLLVLLALDLFCFLAHDVWVLGGKWAGLVLALLAVFSVGLVLAMQRFLVTAVELVAMPWSFERQAATLFFFINWSDVFNGISLFLPAQLLAAAMIFLAYGMLLQFDLLGGDNRVPCPATLSRGRSDPTEQTVRRLLYPLVTRLCARKSIVLTVGALGVCGSWLISLYAQSDFSEPLGDFVCAIFIVACAFWGVRFVKTLDICHTFVADLHDLLKGLVSTERERFAVEEWKTTLGRLGPPRKFPLRVFWDHRPKWKLRGREDDLKRAYERLSGTDESGRDERAMTTQRAEELYAQHVELYVRQVLYHLMVLVTGLVIAGGTLFLAAQCFPFNTEPLLQLTTTIMLVAVAVLIVWYYTQLDRDSLVSVLDGSEPFEVEWNWSMLRTTMLPLALGLFSLISQSFPEMWVWLRGVLEPLAHSTG